MGAEAYAPGRVELLGNHTDYNQGLVLTAAIDRGLRVRGERRNDRRILLDSSAMGRFEIGLDELQPQAETRWANYILGVVRGLLDAGIAIEGFSAKIEGNLPGGCGLSSSAALEVATAFFLLKLFSADLPALEIARLCQHAEHSFAGIQSGLLDPVTSIFGRANHLILFDARSEEVRAVSFPLELALLIAESGTERGLAQSAYNLRRAETQAAARALGLAALRDISPNELAERELAPLLRRRAAHIVGENDRVAGALEFLCEQDGAGFGALMNESQESSRDNFENSTPELDLLVEIARDLPGVLGARLTGGGFGGATVTLCTREAATGIAEKLTRRYSARSGITPRVFLCGLGGGAR